MDTDAAGIWHWTSAFRHLEAAEHALHEQLGIAAVTFGWSPRVRVEVDFRAPVRFGDDVSTRLEVSDVGRSSISYDFSLSVDGREVAAGRLVTVIVDDAGPIEVPVEVRSHLTSAGEVATDDR